MAFCEKCGSSINGENFCPSCGAPTHAPSAPPPPPPPFNSAPAQPDFQQQAQEKFEQFTNTTDSTAEFDPQDIQNNKVFAVLAYFGILVLVPILGAKESKFARYHANQGLTLFLAMIAYGFVNGIVSKISYFISYFLGSAVSALLGVVYILFVVLAIIGIVNAAKGQAKELPIIGKFTLLK